MRRKTMQEQKAFQRQRKAVHDLASDIRKLTKNRKPETVMEACRLLYVETQRRHNENLRRELCLA